MIINVIGFLDNGILDEGIRLFVKYNMIIRLFVMITCNKKKSKA